MDRFAMLAKNGYQVWHSRVNLKNPSCVGDEAYKWGIHSDSEIQGRRHLKSRRGTINLSGTTIILQMCFKTF